MQGTYDELATTRRRQLEKRLDEIDAIRTRRGLPGPDDDDDDDRNPGAAGGERSVALTIVTDHAVCAPGFMRMPSRGRG